jgi:GTPase SAR1 family protein
MLEKYTARKAKLLELLKYTLNLAKTIGDEDVEGRLANTIDRLQSHTFSIAIAGEFSTGKSTLINALLGDNILPTALKACTAVVTKVRAIQNDEQPSIQVLFKKSGRRTATIDELGDILTFDRVDNDDEPLEAEILVNKGTFLDQGIEIVDTPGVNDPEARGEQVTLSYLPKADAIIYLTHAARSFKDSELTFIKDRIAKEDVQRVIFVINACDIIDDEQDWEDLRNRSESVLPSQFKKSPKLLISALKALKEKTVSESKTNKELASLELELKQLILRERGEKELLRYSELLQLLIQQLHRNLSGQIQDINLDQSLIERKIQRLGEAIVHLEQSKSNMSYTLQTSYQGCEQSMSLIIRQELDSLRTNLDTLSSKTKAGDNQHDIRRQAEQTVSNQMKRILTSLQSELRSKQDFIAKQLSSSLQNALGKADLMIEPSSSMSMMQIQHADFSDLVEVNSRQVQEEVEVQERVPFVVNDTSIFMGGVGAAIGAALLGPLGFWAGMMIGGGLSSMENNYQTVTRKVQEFFMVQTIESTKIIQTCESRLQTTKDQVISELKKKTTLDVYQVFDQRIAEYRRSINHLRTPTRSEISKEGLKAELELKMEKLQPLVKLLNNKLPSK